MKIKKLYYSLRSKFVAWLIVDVLKIDFFIDWDKDRIFFWFKYGDGLQKWYKVNRTAGELHDRIYLKKHSRTK